MMKGKNLLLYILFVLFSSSSLASSRLYWLKVDGIIDPAIVDYIEKGIKQAEEEKAIGVIVTIDTPGGMLDSTKKIVQKFLDSKVAVISYVYPKGASATSAGMMLTIAGHIALMAPGTNIGAAHPVLMPFMVKYQPVPEEDVMMKKATEDTAGWVRSIAEVRGRNSSWAEKAVKKSESITAQEALKLKVIDGIVSDFSELKKFIDKRKVKLDEKNEIVLLSRDAEIIEFEMTLSQRLQHIINNPNFILILLLLGALGIAIEIKNPGLIFPGVLGAGLILIALLAPSLQINYIGLLLIAIGIGFLIGEIFITSYGLLAVGGVLSLVAGSLILFQTKEAMNVRVSYSLIIPLVITVSAILLIVGTLVYRAHREKVMTGKEELIGAFAEAITDIAPRGKVFVNGEYWNAVSDEEIKKGERVVIESIRNLELKVKKG